MGTKVVDNRDPLAAENVISGAIINIGFEVINYQVNLIFPQADTGGSSGLVFYTLVYSVSAL
jgi:hypothetical protein